ncbi:MAG TPA: S41 family peptidase [Terriglobales bacterium]|nr:S41 family peptidase [Terriglobales bacterium]
MKAVRTLSGILLLGLLAGAQARLALTQPALSPGGTQIAFVAGNAIWTAPAAGGAAHLLVADGATETKPLYSPDGQWLAFDSSRSGGGDIYLLERATGQLRRLTWDDGMDALDSWSPDSQWVYFSSSSHNVGGMNDIYRVRTNGWRGPLRGCAARPAWCSPRLGGPRPQAGAAPRGGTPMIVASERYESEYYAAAAPDGSVTFCAGGEMPLPQWWRDGEAHIDQTAIWRLDPASMRYTELVAGGAKQIWPMWTPDGTSLYFMSDRSGAENIWVKAGAAAPRAVTQFTGGRVLWPTMGAQGRAIVFERDFGIWKLDLKTGRAAALAIELEGAPAGSGREHLTLNTADGMAVSPDGKKIAYTAHGEVFAVGAATGGTAIRLTRTGKLQFELAWSPDSQKLVYVSDREGHDHLFEYDFLAGKEQALTAGASDESRPVFSPDGHWLAFQRGTTDEVAMDLMRPGRPTHGLAEGHFGTPPLSMNNDTMAWSPDSKYVAYLSVADNLFENAFLVPVAGGAGQEVSFLPDANGNSLAWSPDSKYLLLDTSQRTEATRIARVDLVPPAPLFREDTFRKLFEKEPNGGRGGRGGRGAAPATTIVYEGISERTSLLPMSNARDPHLSPDGKWLAYIGSEGGRGGNIYVYSMEPGGMGAGSGRGGAGARAPRQLTSTTTGKSDLQFTADSKEIYFLAGGHIQHVAVGGGAARTVATSAALSVDFNQEKEEVFDEAWRYQRDNYMNPKMNGVDWNAVRARYAPVVAGAETEADLNRVLLEMIGELNSSHSGIAVGGARPTPTTGHLGVFWDRGKYEGEGQFCVSEVVPQSPAAVAGVEVGDCLKTVDGAALGTQSNLDEVLDDTIGHKTTLGMERGGAARTVALQPVNAATEKHLLYLAWVEHNRQRVDQLSHGRLGYIHMADMEPASLDKLYLDLDTTNFARQGVVIDIRNNTGGFVNAYALDVLTRHPYLTMVPRGLGVGIPARVSLGQRALELPTVLITNQNTLSDSEDFTEGYRAMHLGKVVGVPTAGWIIFTSATRLLDGSTLRMPFVRILDHNGKDMELHPRGVDVEAKDPPGSWAAGRDPQLEAAVRTLLGELAPRGARR